ncbi:hypothetical protein IE53DRAFT_407529 [Violaceomyces palustris]|uniref:Uncharacterized protein n=1 Tax=Violaceomyces palustris TaxID=1673888 RepID=A0ACD0NNU4_9BASI|nr:hypothetical protein IE53DRAFT_407529 [Violaceomyces palustris]
MSSSPGLSARASGSCSGSCFTEKDIEYQYLSGYFTAHMLPVPSYRYMYVLWLIVVGFCLLISVGHHFRIGDKTYIGAVWRRWATKNRIIKIGQRKDIYGNKLEKHDGSNEGPELHQYGPPKPRRSIKFPSFGKMLLLFCLVATPVCLTLIGADYIRPTASIFDISESFPPQTSPNTPGISRRAYQVLAKRLQWGIGAYSPVTTYPPSRTLPYRTWWTSGDRTGDMTSALTPLIVLFALKQIPFALLSMRLFGGYGFDRLSFLHKWGGRLVWLFATAHLATWSVQLGKDKRFEKQVWSFVFMWVKFRWGFVSYGFLTAMMLLSVGPMRQNYYEIFYVCHLITVVGFMVTAWLHHPPLGQWMYVPLAWWAAERILRSLKVAWVNGLGFAGRKPQFAVNPKPVQTSALSRNFDEKDFSNAGPSPSRLYDFHGNVAPSNRIGDYAPSHGSDQATTLVERSPTLHPKTDPLHFGPGSNESSYDQQDGAVARRATRKSARYDPVSDLIKDYLPEGEPRFSPNPPPLPVPMSRKYTLEDPGPRPLRPDHGSSSRPQTAETSSSEEGRPRFAGRPRAASKAHSQMTSSTSGHWGITYDPNMPMMKPRPAMSADVAALIRPGYAFAQLLPGKTLRLTLRTPNHMSWKPGQYVNLNIPSVRWWESHPFTIASAHDADFPTSTEFHDTDEEKGLGQESKAKGEERTMVLLLRARKGFTLHLWKHVLKKRSIQLQAASDALPGASLGGFVETPMMTGPVGKGTTGVHLRAIVDGPYGSSSRTDWGSHSTIVIVCGGSGISFGMSALEHLSACMVGAARLGRAGKGGRGFLTQRVRFVWIMREYSHLQWVASALRRCIEMLPPEQLQVDLYVTHFNHQSAIQAAPAMYAPGGLEPPMASWASGLGAGSGIPQPGRFTEGPEQEEYDLTAYDLTHFDGEDQSAPTAAEMEISRRIRTEGKLRRAHTRKATMKRRNGQGRGGASMPRENESTASASQRAIHEARIRPEPPLSSVGEQDIGEHKKGFFEHSRGDSTSTNPTLPPGGPGPRPALLSPNDPYSLGHLAVTPASQGGGLSGFISPDPSAPPSPRMSNAPRSTTYPYGDGHAGGWAAEAPPLGYAFDRDNDSRSFLEGSEGPHPGHYFDGDRRYSTTGLISEAATRAQAEADLAIDDAPIDLDEEEDADLKVVAELARPGHPKLDRIIRQEVDHSQGRILVASCGPSSLGVVIRSIVSKQIDPSKVWKGDLRGHVNVATEAYEWGG